VIKLKRGNRHTWVKSLSEQIQLHIPQDKLQKFCTQRGYGTYATGKATHKPQWMKLTDAEIILAYNGEFRGLANYYALATGVKKTLHKLEWIWQTSLLKTLANKHKTGVNKIVKRRKHAGGSQARREKRARDSLHQCLSPERPQKTSTAQPTARCPTEWVSLDAELLGSHQTTQQEAMRVL
jgi:hypothetical protein